MENWIDIEGYEGLYQVSDLGRIRTHQNKVSFTKRHGIRHWKQRIMKFRGYTPKTGYRISLWKDGNFKEFLVARLVAFNFLGGDINDRWQTVNHINGNRMDNALNNLEIVTLKENIQHAFKTGLMSSCKQTMLKSKQTGETYVFNSQSDASRFLGKNVGYIHSRFKRNKLENDEYYIF